VAPLHRHRQPGRRRRHCCSSACSRRGVWLTVGADRAVSGVRCCVAGDQTGSRCRVGRRDSRRFEVAAGPLDHPGGQPGRLRIEPFLPSVTPASSSRRPEHQGTVATPSSPAWRGASRSVVGAASRAPDQKPVTNRSHPRRARRLWIRGRLAPIPPCRSGWRRRWSCYSSRAPCPSRPCTHRFRLTL
jgi:hypothetical protein